MRQYCIFVYSDYSKLWFKDASTHKDVHLVDCTEFETDKHFALRLMSSLEHRMNILGLPGKLLDRLASSQILSKIAETSLKPSNEIVFLFFEHSYGNKNDELLFRIRSRYLNSKLVFMFTNVDNEMLSCVDRMDRLKRTYDKIVTFDFEMAEKHGIVHLDFPYPAQVSPENEKPKIDVGFSGSDKGRIDKLIKISDYLYSNDVSHEFWVYGERPSQLPSYLENSFVFSPEQFAYAQTEDIIRKSACILELVNDNDPMYQNSYTIRVQEAVAFGKKLLTNCKGVLKAPFYNHQQMRYFQHIEQIDVNFLKREFSGKLIDKDYFSPRSFLERL